MDDFFDDESHKRPINDQLQSELSFIVEHEKSLHKHTNKNEAIHDVPNSYYKPFRLAKEPRERVVPSDLWTITENAHLRKVLTVLVFLCDEVTDLLDIVDDKVFNPLSLFGSRPVKPMTTGKNQFPLLPSSVTCTRLFWILPPSIHPSFLPSIFLTLSSAFPVARSR